MRNPYETLGVEKNVSEKELKAAYRKLAFQNHPDRNQNDPKAEERLKEINVAYETLSDPKKRHQYDQFGEVGQQTSGINIDDLFRGGFGFNVEDFLGGNSKRKSVFKGEDIHKNIKIEFMEAVFGCKKTIKLSYTIGCKECSGTGAEGGTKFSACGACDGSGKTGYQSGFMRVMSTCRACGGSGRKIDSKCISCAGIGQKRTEEKLNVNIPAGIDEGTTMRLSGKGFAGMNGGLAGDLFIVVSINKHQKFNRRQLDIITTENIDYLDAILGAEYEIKTVNGNTTLKIPAFTQTGMVLKLDGQGINNGKTKGSHYASINVRLPSELSNEEKNLLNNLKKLRSKK